jgi:hypothetical protein
VIVVTEDLAARMCAARLTTDLNAAPVQIGAARGWWRLERVAYPELVVAFTASPRTYRPGRVALRYDVAGYADTPATGCAWDLETDAPLPAGRRPTGGRATLTFRTDWEDGRALYLPCDRVAVAGHAAWPGAHAGDLWNPREGIAKYLRLVHTILTEADDAYQLDAA